MHFFSLHLQCHSPRFPSGLVEEFSSHAGADVGRKRLPCHWLFAREGKIVINSLIFVQNCVWFKLALLLWYRVESSLHHAPKSFVPCLVFLLVKRLENNYMLKAWNALSVSPPKPCLSLCLPLSPHQSSRMHITRAVLEQFLSFAKYLDGLTHGAPLLKQLCDHVLFNAAIWIHTPAKVSSSHVKSHVSHLCPLLLNVAMPLLLLFK